MPRYTYQCRNCKTYYQADLTVAERLLPCEVPCDKCGELTVFKLIDSVPFRIKGFSEANGYSDTVGDIEKHTGKEFNYDRDVGGESIPESFPELTDED